MNKMMTDQATNSDPYPDEGVELLGATITPTLGYEDPDNYWYPAIWTTDANHIFDVRVHTLPEWIVRVVPDDDKPFSRRMGGLEVEHGDA